MFQGSGFEDLEPAACRVNLADWFHDCCLQSTWRLPCSSCLVLTCFPNGVSSILPNIVGVSR